MNTVHDVLIVGAGPVGLAAARMLGLRGHAVLVSSDGWNRIHCHGPRTSTTRSGGCFNLLISLTR